jgi:hypothetical protein
VAKGKPPPKKGKGIFSGRASIKKGFSKNPTGVTYAKGGKGYTGNKW